MSNNNYYDDLGPRRKLIYKSYLFENELNPETGQPLEDIKKTYRLSVLADRQRGLDVTLTQMHETSSDTRLPQLHHTSSLAITGFVLLLSLPIMAAAFVIFATTLIFLKPFVTFLATVIRITFDLIRDSFNTKSDHAVETRHTSLR